MRKITPSGRAAFGRTKGVDHRALGAVPPPTCAICKYRSAVLGFQGDIGAIRKSYHHYVKGHCASAPVSTVADCKLCDTCGTGLCWLKMQDKHAHHHHYHDHDHDHAHPTSPHANHPHARESARKTKE